MSPPYAALSTQCVRQPRARIGVLGLRGASPLLVWKRTVRSCHRWTAAGHNR